MKRYKKANEGIHAPEEVKEKAARPAGKRSRARWVGAVAAVLAAALIGGAAWPSLRRTVEPNEPGPLSLDGPGIRTVSPPGGRALALAAYPEMAPYPNEEDYISPLTGEFDYDEYNKGYYAWQESWRTLRSGTDYTGMLDGFLSASTVRFLTGAGTENRVYSPLNVYLALSMLAETAGGNSRQQILDLLGADSIEALRSRASTLWKDNYRDDGVAASILANSLWLRDGMTYSQSVLDTLASDYRASSFSGEMGTQEYDQVLRGWLNEQTHGLLEEQANGLSMDPATVLALASAIYFRTAWSDKFSEDRTERDIFHAPGGEAETDFMRRSMDETYYWGERFAAVQLYFQQGGSMWLILPDEGYSVDELLSSGEAMDFLLMNKRGYAGSKYLTINLSMPKFDVSSDLDLIEGLMALGVTDVFDDSVSNFDPLEASADEALYVSQVRHAARVKVDEEGCEAAAYTVLTINTTSALMPPDNEVDFILDRPFLFVITGDSGLPLFTGVVNRPNG